MDVFSYLDRRAAVKPFDIIIADPPYAHLEADIIEHLADFLAPGGVLALSHSSKTASPVLKSVELAVAKTYGDTALSFYKSIIRAL